MSYGGKLACSSCGGFRPIEDFRFNKKGDRKKTCFRHEKKRKERPANDDWDTFIEFLSSCSQSKDSNPVEMKRVFGLEELPFAFGAKLSVDETGKPDRKPMNEAVKGLANLIWEVGGYRFRLCTNASYNCTYTYVYHCCQDESKVEAPPENPIRKLERFKCESKLNFTVSLDDRTLKIAYRHLHHRQYTRTHLSANRRKFIDNRFVART